MNSLTKLNQYYLDAKQNRWFNYFTIFCRISLAMGFLFAGYVKVIGERFTDLSNNQPMGAYLEALHHTGYYYTMIGIAQITAAVLLLIPRTATFGAMLYFPIILNIFILSLAVRFEGSLISSPLMVLANLYLLCWDYDKLKYALPFYRSEVAKPKVYTNKFPIGFFAGVFAAFVALIITLTNVYSIMPRNTIKDCGVQCATSKDPQACYNFCDCIHTKGQPLSKCLDQYNKALKAAEQKK